jgi:hypothetical protein
MYEGLSYDVAMKGLCTRALELRGYIYIQNASAGDCVYRGWLDAAFNKDWAIAIGVGRVVDKHDNDIQSCIQKHLILDLDGGVDTIKGFDRMRPGGIDQLAP